LTAFSYHPIHVNVRVKTTTWVLLSPWIVTLLLFWLYPLLHSFYLSFTDYSILGGETHWVGLENFKRLSSDEGFIKALENTSIFVFGTIPFTTVLALLLAVIISRKIPGAGIFRAGFFVPSITSMVVMALIFTNLYSAGGYINLLLKLTGLPFPKDGWLHSEKTALPAIMIMDVWIAIGYYMLLYLAALKGIPGELYEAAELEGAGAFRRFWHITLPHLRPMTLFVVVINTIRSFQIFVEIFVMTKGGPLDSTLTVVYFVFEEGLQRFDMGYASAAAYVLFMIIALFSAVQLKLFGLGKRIAD
jgi:multiple sugar transport system permease protein